MLFFGFVLLGAIAIWTMKSVGFNQYAVTAVPISLMIVYAIIALTTKRNRLREDRVGDNVYYLGFLFTLVSLAYALHVYSPDGSGATEIITNFGIAVFTTILGLAGRVLFSQMREDPEEYEREARLSLAEASSELRAQLFGIAGDLYLSIPSGRCFRSRKRRNKRRCRYRKNVDVQHRSISFAGIANEVIEKDTVGFRSVFRTIPLS